MILATQAIQGEAYAGFNIIVGDLGTGQVAYYGNKGSSGPQQLQSGVHGRRRMTAPIAAAAVALQVTYAVQLQAPAWHSQNRATSCCPEACCQSNATGANHSTCVQHMPCMVHCT